MKTYKYITFLLFIFLITSDASSSPGVYKDPVSLIRAGRWLDVKNYFQVKKPYALQQKYIHARAVENYGNQNNLDNTAESIQHYLFVLNISCSQISSEDDFLKCLAKHSRKQKKNLHERLAIYHAANAASKKKWLKLNLAILKLSSLRENDPLTRNIYGDTIAALLNLHYNEEALALSSKHNNLSSPVLDMRRAAAYNKAGRKSESIEFYLKAASQTNTSWILKSIYTNLKKNYPDLFSTENSSRQILRYLVSFSAYMNEAELKFIKSKISHRALISTSGQETILHDGIFLIKTNQAKHTRILSEKNYTYLSQNPDIIRIWIQSMGKKDFRHAVNLLKIFHHAKQNRASLWRAEIDLLEDSGSKTLYFNELVGYLKKNHSDYRLADKLLAELIGTDSGKIKWADHNLWEKARTELTGHTGSGRFIYWLKRYYEHKKDAESLKDLREHFYELSPGSYYSQSFWDETKSGNYSSDWYKVYDRKSYLRWISRHGGNPQAVKFLSGKHIEPYRDINSVKLAGYLKNISYNIPYEIRELYTLGEFALAENFYSDYYADKISYTENLLRKYHLGKVTGNLHMSTYYMRSLLREYNIPEDPFSLHPFILEDLYPRPYLTTVKKYARIYKIDENMIYGLMRQESMFRETAVSRSGAMGLMQIMPRTGKWLAGLMKINNPDLMKPETSIQMGAKFFGDLIRRNNNDFRWASIAYNGGPGNLRKWKRRHYSGDFNLFLEQLPVQEPRNYCRFTYQNYNHYKIAYTLHP